MKNILVIGDTILDEYIYIKPKKMSEEAYVITSEITHKKYSLGGGANVARNITSQGHKCTYVGLSSKQYQKEIKQQMDFMNINHQLFNVDDSIQIKTRIISSYGTQICRFDTQINPKINNNLYQDIIEWLELNLQKYDFLIISKYYDFFITQTFIQEVIHIAKKHNIKIIVDNRQSNAYIFNNVDFYKVNFNEFKALFNANIENDFESIKTIISQNQFNFHYLIITRSNLSTIVYDSYQKQFFQIKVNDVKVKDVSGAGDTFIASFAINYDSNLSITDIINECHKICNIVVRKLGTDVVWSYEFDNNLDISIVAKQLKQNNKRIVFTNGVFDILHSGHIKLLKQAKEYGDYLIVGLNSDQSVKKLKGDSRPFKPQQERKLILESLEFIDKVVIFDQLDVKQLLKDIKPNVYVKGGDYKIDTLPEKDYLKYVNKVVFVDLVLNKSSTSIIEKIKYEH